MTSAEKLILENQQEIMAALSLLLRTAQPLPEMQAARHLSGQCSKVSSVLHAAKVWSNE
jgi:hypothetical protein